MAYTVSMVRNSNPAVLVTASGDAGTSAARVDAQISQGRRQIEKLAGNWTGDASDAAQKQHRELREDQAALSAALRRVRETLSDWGPQLAAKRSALDTAVDDAEDWWNVADSGSVSPGAWLSWFASLSATNAVLVEAQRLERENTIKLLLATFEADDVAAGRALRTIGWDLA